MEYKPKVITGKVTGTGWPIDGHVLWFSQWDYDNRESWHLYGWEDSEDEAVMQTVFQTETEAGLCLFDTLEKFTENWKAKKWEPQGSFCLPLDKVEVLEVKQEESTNNTRERLRAHGFDLTPRKQTDRGGILCLPLDKNLNGDVQAKHPDWDPVECPTCGRKCWKHPEADRLAKEQGAKMLCTECAIKAGLLSPFRKEGPNRAQRRRAKRDLNDIEKQAHRLAESTTLSYSEALYKIGGDMLRGNPEKPAPLYHWPIRREPVRPNRAARRAAKRKGGRNGR